MNKGEFFSVACLLLSAVLVGAVIGSIMRSWFDADRIVYRTEAVTRVVEPELRFDYAEDAVNKQIAGMVEEGSHPYMGDSGIRAWGDSLESSHNSWDGMRLSCFGRKYLHYVSHNKSFREFTEKCG